MNKNIRSHGILPWFRFAKPVPSTYMEGVLLPRFLFPTQNPSRYVEGTAATNAAGKDSGAEPVSSWVIASIQCSIQIHSCIIMAYA